LGLAASRILLLIRRGESQMAGLRNDLVLAREEGKAARAQLQEAERLLRDAESRATAAEAESARLAAAAAEERSAGRREGLDEGRAAGLAEGRAAAAEHAGGSAEADQLRAEVERLERALDEARGGLEGATGVGAAGEELARVQGELEEARRASEAAAAEAAAVRAQSTAMLKKAVETKKRLEARLAEALAARSSGGGEGSGGGAGGGGDCDAEVLRTQLDSLSERLQEVLVEREEEKTALKDRIQVVQGPDPGAAGRLSASAIAP
jgi:hypothetical protein